MIVMLWYPFSHDQAMRSRGCRHRVTLTLTNLVVLIYGLRTERCLETTSISSFISYDLHTVPRVHMATYRRVVFEVQPTRCACLTRESQFENAVVCIIQIL